VVESAADILDELGWPGAGPRPGASKSLQPEPLLARMAPGEPYGLDALAAATGMDGARLLARLAELELAGHIEVAGGRFVRRT
jgi:predicted Rossmann fold nucleotide-binding protein DprA/Smf involved in DNA uptake